MIMFQRETFKVLQKDVPGPQSWKNVYLVLKDLHVSQKDKELNYKLSKVNTVY